MTVTAVTKINSGQVRFQDPKAVIFFPWSQGKPGTTGYDIHDIVGDTFSLTQDDADRTEIPWEFGDEPLDENISLGNRSLTMQCLDYQDDIMENLFGWTKDSTNGVTYAPTQYEELVCTIMLMFEDKCIIMPKVKMDSKTAFENLRTDIARGELGGTLYSTGVIWGSGTTPNETGLAFMKYPTSSTKSFSIGDTYSGSTWSGGTKINVSSTGEVTTGTDA